MPIDVARKFSYEFAAPIAVPKTSRIETFYALAERLNNGFSARHTHDAKSDKYNQTASAPIPSSFPSFCYKSQTTSETISFSTPIIFFLIAILFHIKPYKNVLLFSITTPLKFNIFSAR